MRQWPKPQLPNGAQKVARLSFSTVFMNGAHPYRPQEGTAARREGSREAKRVWCRSLPHSCGPLTAGEGLAACLSTSAERGHPSGADARLDCHWPASSASATSAESGGLRRINRGRIEFGRYTLAGLELLIVLDIIHSAPSLAIADVIYLGLLVLIRSLISYFLDRELGQLRQEPSEGMSVERSEDEGRRR